MLSPCAKLCQHRNASRNFGDQLGVSGSAMHLVHGHMCVTGRQVTRLKVQKAGGFAPPFKDSCWLQTSYSRVTAAPTLASTPFSKSLFNEQATRVKSSMKSEPGTLEMPRNVC